MQKDSPWVDQATTCGSSTSISASFFGKVVELEELEAAVAAAVVVAGPGVGAPEARLLAPTSLPDGVLAVLQSLTLPLSSPLRVVR